MKIKKLLPNQVVEKTLGYKDYRKGLKPSLKMMESKCNTPETATDCLIKVNYEFSDMPKKKMGLIIVGKQSGAWIKCAKDEAKNDKKFTLLGKCYIKTSSNGVKTLVVTPTKGGAKKALVQRQVKKFAFKGYPYELQVGEMIEEVVVDQEDNVQEPLTTSTNETSTTNELTDEQLKRKNRMEARMKKMDEQIARLKAQLKIA